MAKRQFDKKRPDIKVALELGWTYTGVTGSGHLSFAHDGCPTPLILANTRSEYRGLRNAISQIRKMTPLRED